MSIDAMKMGVVKEVWVAAYDRFFVGAMERPQSSQGTAMENEADCARRMVRCPSWNSFLTSIGAMRMVVV